MRGKLWVVLFALCFSCVEDEFPEGIYHYQVERLLSNGDSKTWILASQTNDGVVITPGACQDSIRLQVTQVEDSVGFTRLIPTSDCTDFDSNSLGNANASGTLLFTDSLLFGDGTIWKIQSVLPDELIVEESDVLIRYVNN